MPVTLDGILKAAVAVFAPLMKRAAALKGQKKAALEPEKFQSPDQLAFDEAFAGLAGQETTKNVIAKLGSSAAAAYVVPEYLRTRSVHEWLLLPGVKVALQQACASKNLGLAQRPEQSQWLEEKYGEVASANAQEARGVVAAVVAMLAASTQGKVIDQGTAALVAAGTRAIIDSIAEQRTDEALAKSDAHVQLGSEELRSWRAAFRIASSELLNWPTTLKGGKHISRPEGEKLTELIVAKTHGTVALLGEPGAGKSALLASFGNQLLSQEGLSLLAIKGDLLDPNVSSEQDLQRSLNLPQLPSRMIQRLAMSGAVVLLIDQLDALAGHLDTKTGRLSALLNLVKGVSHLESVHVVVSCRTFEFAHDVRISKIEAASLNLELPAWEAVLPILESAGANAADWHEEAKALLRVPQQLNIFLSLCSDGHTEPFENYTVMLERLWTLRVLNVAGGVEAAQVAYEVAEEMAEKEALWVAGARFDHRMEQLDLLAAAGILTRSREGAIGFTHQTVFEHILARSFARGDGRLSAYVLARATSLFVRPKLWAALSYLRGVEPGTYEAELSTIWNAPQLRKHLRFLLLEFMGSQSSPTDREQSLVVGASEQEDLLPFVLKSIVGSRGWFARLGGSVLASAMANPKRADNCIQLLTSAWDHSPFEVPRLIRDVWLLDSSNDWRTLVVLQDAPAWTPDLVNLGRSVAERCDLSETHIDHVIAGIGGEHPEVAIDLLHGFLTNLWAKRRADAQLKKARLEEPNAEKRDGTLAWHMNHNPMRPLSEFFDDRNQWDSLPELAAAAPSKFLAVLWPWYLGAFRDMHSLATWDVPSFGYPLAYLADFRFESESGNDLQASSILEALTIAIEAIAQSSSSELLRWAASQESEELTPVQRLVAYALRVNPRETASAALEFLLADERRYFLGGVTDSSSTTTRLVSACAPYWTEAQRSRFFERVRGFNAKRPAGVDVDARAVSRLARRTRVNLVRALPEAVRTKEVSRAIEEANRVIPQRTVLDDFKGGWIGPTMSEAQFAKASTAAIVNAFEQIPDTADWDHPKHFGRGGNIQLSRSFADFAAKEPEKAIQAIKEFRPQFGQRAAGYALESLAESYDPPSLLALVVHLASRGFGEPEFRSSVARTVERLVNRSADIAEPVQKVLEDWVYEDAKSHGEQNFESGEGQATDELKRDRFLLSGHGQVETVPEGDYPILSALVSAKYAKEDWLGVVKVARRYLGISQDPRQWNSLARRLAHLAYSEEPEVPTLIGEVLALRDLDGRQGAAYLMAHAYHKALRQVMDSLTHWRVSDRQSARKGFGELVTLISVTKPDDLESKLWLIEILMASGMTDARLGAAATAVRILWPEAQYRAAATDVIVELLPRNESDVWHQVFGLFGAVDKLEQDSNTLRLLNCIAQNIHEAPAPTEPYLVERLSGLLPIHAALVAAIASQLIQLWRDKLSNMGSSLVMAGQEMIDLAITLHRTEGTELSGLQMFEQLVEIDAYQAREVLDEIDRRLRNGVKAGRPRLKRRGARRGRKRGGGQDPQAASAS